MIGRLISADEARRRDLGFFRGALVAAVLGLAVIAVWAGLIAFVISNG